MRLFPALLAAAMLGRGFDAPAQTAQFTDPANLRGERVSPRDGRELPIDQSEAQGGRGLEQMLRKLNTRASLMLIVAHPDDEDGGMLTLYSRGLGARVATLTLTRGEGGQNAVTGDFEDALGLLRTQELLAADRYMGVDQMFGTEVDFGFSKTKEEAFRKWTHERVLYDAVRAVRLYRPLVIAAVFIGGVTDGHGQHQVSGEIAQEVFKAAGDPKVFPEMIAEGILPWQPLKVYARVPRQAVTAQGLFDYATGQYTPARFTNYVTGEVSTTPPTVDVVVHEGQTDPLLTTCAASLNDLPGRISSASTSGESIRAVPDTGHTPTSPGPSTPIPTPSSGCTPLSYVQFARIGLGLQKTQIGPGVRMAPAGTFDIGYHLYGSRLCPTNPARATGRLTHDAVILSGAKDPCISPVAPIASTESPARGPASFFDGIDTSIEGIATLAPNAPAPLRARLTRLSTAIKSATAAFDPSNPSAIAPQLRDALQITDATITTAQDLSFGSPEAKTNILHELRIKAVQLNDALALALGIHLDATATAPARNVIAQTPLSVATNLTTTWPEKLYNQRQMVRTSGQQTSLGFVYADNNPGFSSGHTFENTLTIQSKTVSEITRPYFFRHNIEQPFYDLTTPALRNAPATPSALTVWATVLFGSEPIEVGRLVHEGDQPLQIVPPVSISVPIHAQILPANNSSLTLTVFTTPPVGRQTITTPPYWTTTADPENTFGSGQYMYHLQVPSQRGSAIIQAEATLPDGKSFSEGFRSIGYPGIPYTNFFTPAIDRVVPVDLQLPTRRRIAYLPGTGDAVPEALASIGLPVSTLTVSDLTPEHLAQFDTVILGVRTYVAHPELHGASTQALIDYARSGGNVIVQYQIADFTAADTPYPLSLGSTEKVVDETTPVHLLDPSAPLVHSPNKITSADFNGWIEERGHGFLSTWDPHYTALTETHDPGGSETKAQEPQRGGLITVQLGKGHWTYCAFALYRQLPEAVPGAYRLFANLLGLADAR